MNPFELCTLDCMTNPDFTDTAVFRGVDISVVLSERSESPVVTEFGFDDGVLFFLRVQASLLSSPPKKNERVAYKSVSYRVDHADLDASGLVWRIYLKSLTS